MLRFRAQKLSDWENFRVLKYSNLVIWFFVYGRPSMSSVAGAKKLILYF